MPVSTNAPKSGEPPAEAMPIATSADYYEVLGVSRKATSREIRRAYRALARQCHPDLNPADKLAAQKFREIQEAYEVLGDARKRKAYDYYGAGFGERVPSVVVERVKQPEARSVPREARPRVAIDFGPSDFPRRPARFAGIPISRLGSLAFAGVFLIGTYVYFLLPDPGVKEFQRARDALRHAQSWKKENQLIGTGFTSGEYYEELSCPASERYTQRLETTVDGRPTEIRIETIIIGNDRYTNANRGANWAHDYVSGSGIANDCQKLSLGEDAAQLPSLGEWLAGAYAIKKEGVRVTSEGACREWKVRGPGGLYGQPSVDWVCLGIKDHLPKFQGEPGNRQETRYYDWNVPVDIQRPIPAP